MVFSLRTKLAASIVVVVLAMGATSTVVGTRLLGDGLVRQVQRNVEQDLNTAYLLYNSHLGELEMLVQVIASDPYVARELAQGRSSVLSTFLEERMRAWGLDMLTLTDGDGNVLARGRSRSGVGDNVADDQLVRRVIGGLAPASGTVVVTSAALEKEAPELAERARIRLLETPRARPSSGEVLEDAMMLKAAAPVFRRGELLGVLYSGILLTRSVDIVDRVKETAYGDETWRGKDTGTVTIFQDDVRIATNVVAANGERAIGTRVSEEVYNHVVGGGKRWIARAFVVDDWYITAYGPIRDPDDTIVGVLYVGVLAGEFDALRGRTVWTFVGVSVAGMAFALIMASVLSSGILRPIADLAKASKDIAHGRFTTRVDVGPQEGGEFVKLADAYNFMARSIAERDQKLKENARKMTESRKLATLGQLAAGIAHEINNPLGGIVMYGHILREDLQEPENRENVEKICREAERCKRIVKGLLDFARQTKPERTQSNINHVLNEVMALLEQQAIFHNIEVVRDHNPSLPLVDVDVAQMEEVFMNLVLNAAQSMEGKGTLTTLTRLSDDKDFVEVEIRDTGPGIAPDNLDKIFEPFFTTKDVGRGTGLGLAIAYGIVERHHGRIWVESELGRGTSFFVRIPIPEVAPEM
jgi:two-component system NtrC family sensor kinase